jgi:hypothetical protein
MNIEGLCRLDNIAAEVGKILPPGFEPESYSGAANFPQVFLYIFSLPTFSWQLFL